MTANLIQDNFLPMLSVRNLFSVEGADEHRCTEHAAQKTASTLSMKAFIVKKAAPIKRLLITRLARSNTLYSVSKHVSC
jgi:hypothetical protein